MSGAMPVKEPALKYYFTEYVRPYDPSWGQTVRWLGYCIFDKYLRLVNAGWAVYLLKYNVRP